MLSLSATAQTLVNRAWVAQYGLPDTVAWSASTADGSGNLYTTGNTFVPGHGADVLLTRYDPEGNLLWQQTYDHQGQNDYGVAILQHANGELTVAAALHDATDSFDVGLLRYDGSGNLLWSYSYDYQGQYDVPTALAEDAQGNLYVCAASLGSSTDLDYLTLKVKEDGTFEWMQSYDFAAGRDVPVSLVVDGNHITVTGASEDSTGQWDFYTVMYDDNGTVMEEYRLDKPGIGFDEPAGIARDAAGNFYLTGRASDNGTEYYIQTVKLDASLNLVWEVAYNHSGQDGATGLGLDSQGNVYVCGYLAEPTGQELVLLKYDPNGNLLWDRTETSESGGPAAATHLHIDQEDQVFLTGYQAVNSQQRLYVAAFSSDGEKLWERSVEDGDYAGGEIITQGADAYVSAKSFSNGNYQYVAVKYAWYEDEVQVQLDSTSTPTHAKGEVLIRFHQSALRMPAMADRDRMFGRIEEFLVPQVISDMEAKLAMSLAGATIVKVFFRLSPYDSLSVTRLGDTIRIAPLWRTLRLKLPPSVAALRSSDPEQQVVDSLNTLPEHILYAEKDYVAFPTSQPDDSLYQDLQASLKPTPGFDTTSHINVEGAWAISVGSPTAKVGVYDDGIDFTHEDWDPTGSGGASTLADSKIEGGWDFTLHQAAGASSATEDGHGQKVAGIIGALRNNSIGVAGIAGGDLQMNSNTGCQIFDLQIRGIGSGFALAHHIADAIVEGSVWTPSFGYGLHVQNHSWRTIPGPGNDLPGLVQDAMEEVLRNGCVFVASRGNAGIDNEQYPATARDELVLCVGASGDNGERLDPASGNQRGSTAASSFGSGMDVLAPGARDMILTLQADTADAYTNFRHTSAAAPHVAGVAALMIDHILTTPGTPNPLAPEDVEQIIQRTAQDKGGPANIGYDDESGWGLLDATAALQAIEFPFFEVVHIPVDVNQPHVLTASFNKLHDNVPLILGVGIKQFSSGVYYGADIYQLQFLVDHGAYIPASWQVIDKWPLHGASEGWPTDANNITSIHNQIEFRPSFSAAPDTLRAYFIDMGSTWLPSNPYDARMRYTIYAQTNVSTQIQDRAISSAQVRVFPNPTSGELQVAYTGLPRGQYQVTVQNVLGQPVMRRALAVPHGAEKGQLTLDTRAWARGVYHLSLHHPNGLLHTAKVVVQ